MKIDPLFDQVALIEADIARLRTWGATVQADTLERACDRFRVAISEWLDEPLTVGDAAEECPWWEPGTIAKKLRSGDLPQAGAPGAPLVRRRDLFGVSDGRNPDLASWAEELVDG